MENTTLSTFVRMAKNSTHTNMSIWIQITNKLVVQAVGLMLPNLMMIIVQTTIRIQTKLTLQNGFMHERMRPSLQIGHVSGHAPAAEGTMHTISHRLLRTHIHLCCTISAFFLATCVSDVFVGDKEFTRRDVGERGVKAFLAGHARSLDAPQERTLPRCFSRSSDMCVGALSAACALCMCGRLDKGWSSFHYEDASKRELTRPKDQRLVSFKTFI